MEQGFDEKEILKYLNIIESKSTHPIATAVHEYVGEIDHSVNMENVEEISGHGLKGTVNGKEFLAGNFKLMDKFSVPYTVDHKSVADTLIAVAYGGKFAGYLTISDKIKEDAKNTVDALIKLGVKPTMLSGDKTAVVQEVAQKIGITNYFGDLLPEDKVNKVKEIKSRNETVAFVGDGVNDAPVVALSDVGLVAVLYLFSVKDAGNFSRITFFLMALFYGLLTYGTRLLWKKHILRTLHLKQNKSVLVITNFDRLSQVEKDIRAKRYVMFQISGVAVTGNMPEDHPTEIAGIPLVAAGDYDGC
jgi:soluble P-type ATPase